MNFTSSEPKTDGVQSSGRFLHYFILFYLEFSNVAPLVSSINANIDLFVSHLDVSSKDSLICSASHNAIPSMNSTDQPPSLGREHYTHHRSRKRDYTQEMTTFCS